jgi:cyanate permease
MPRPLRAGLILLGLLLVAANRPAAITTDGSVVRNIEADQHLSSAAAPVLDTRDRHLGAASMAGAMAGAALLRV